MGAFSFVACVSHLITLTTAPPSRRSTIPIPNRGPSNVFALIMLFSRQVYYFKTFCLSHLSPSLVETAFPPPGLAFGRRHHFHPEDIVAPATIRTFDDSGARLLPPVAATYDGDSPPEPSAREPASHSRSRAFHTPTANVAGGASHTANGEAGRVRVAPKARHLPTGQSLPPPRPPSTRPLLAHRPNQRRRNHRRLHRHPPSHAYRHRRHFRERRR